ncbi:MAG: ATP-binding cassette domain-containing protein [Rhodospirillales bacterium]|nr:MAG: ATP-binding cassette domain-containing protein [Rhodospirillales bacterium]
MEKQRRNFVKPLLNLLGLIGRGQLPAFLGLLIAVGGAAGITLAFGHVIKNLVDQGFTGAGAAHLDRTLMLMVALVAGLALSSFSRLSLAGWLSERLVADLRTRAFARLLMLDPGYYHKRLSHEIATALSADTALIGTTMATSLPLVLRNILLVLGGMAMLLTTAPRLTLLVLLVMPLVALPVIVIGRVVRGNARHAQERTGALGGLMGETLAAIQTVQSFTAETRLSERYRRDAEDVLRADMRQILSRAAMVASIIFILFSSLCGVMWLGAHDVMAGRLSAGALTGFVFYAAIVASAFGILGDVGAAVFRAAAALERVREMLALEPAITSAADAKPLAVPARGDIAVENLSFAYGDAPILDGLTLQVRAGETVAVVGASGAGKTTLFQMLMRFADPQRGRVLLDGQDISDLKLEDLRGAIAYVPQDGALFSTSVRDNIRLGDPDATQDRVEAAARDAQAHDFIMAMPHGYDTELGERGTRLSGGQRQRIALARALLKPAPVLLLDEATAALDSENEKAIQQAVRALHGRRTVLIIAHRLSTVLEADRIFVLNDGRVAEEGTHAELVRKGGLYARMWEQQFSMAETQARAAHPNVSGVFH